MKIYTGNSNVSPFEHLIETPQQVVTHLVLKAGEVLPNHHVPYSVIVVPIKGQTIFSDETSAEEIYPGKIVQMTPDEIHGLKAITDSELMVIKSQLKE